VTHAWVNFKRVNFTANEVRTAYGPRAREDPHWAEGPARAVTKIEGSRIECGYEWEATRE